MCELYIFSQEINIYNTIPATINLKVIEPRQPVEQVDWFKIGTDFSNQLSQIASEKEEKIKLLNNMTLSAKSFVSSNLSVGYHSHLNSVFGNLQSNLIQQIETDQKLLMSGFSNSDSYAYVLNSKVNTYSNFINYFDRINEIIKKTIDDLLMKNQIVLLNDLSFLLDNICSKYAFILSSDSRKVGRYSSEQYNIRIEILTRKNLNISISQMQFQNEIVSICELIYKAGLNSNNDVSNQIFLDQQLFTNEISGNNQLSLPITFIDGERKYSDGTRLRVSLEESIIDNKTNIRFQSQELDKYFQVLLNRFNPSIPSLNFEVDSNFLVKKLMSSTNYIDIQVGDKIVAINNNKLISLNQLELNQSKVGDKISIVIIRNGIKKTVNGILKEKQGVVDCFEIDVSNRKAVLYSYVDDIMEYGEHIKIVNVITIYPKDNYPLELSAIKFSITPSKVLNSNNADILKRFKPLIKSINDHIVVN